MSKEARYGGKVFGRGVTDGKRWEGSCAFWEAPQTVWTPGGYCSVLEMSNSSGQNGGKVARSLYRNQSVNAINSVLIDVNLSGKCQREVHVVNQSVCSRGLRAQV